MKLWESFFKKQPEPEILRVSMEEARGILALSLGIVGRPDSEWVLEMHAEAIMHCLSGSGYEIAKRNSVVSP